MNFDTMDWVAEAKRVRRAFGVEDGEFEYDSGEFRMMLVCDTRLWVSYDSLQRIFNVYTVAKGTGEIVLNWDGSPKYYRPNRMGLVLARALFYLDLLTPDVEITLGGAISAHQKLEWTLAHAETAINSLD